MNWDVFTKLSPFEIQFHWITVSLAFVFGLIIFSQKKGTGFHKAMGWSYVILMVATMVAAFFIRSPGGYTLAPGLSGFSLIHLFIPFTAFGLGGALIAIKRGRSRHHARGMISTFLGALLIAGLFTLLPGRRMNLLLFGDASEIQERVDRGDRAE